MFNFFDEIKSKLGKIDDNFYNDFNIINLSGKLLYIEGHKGLTILSNNMIALKVKKGRIVIEGKNMIMKELTENTILIDGEITKVELF